MGVKFSALQLLSSDTVRHPDGLGVSATLLSNTTYTDSSYLNHYNLAFAVYHHIVLRIQTFMT